MKKRVVIYARFSSHSQTEQSIEGQLRECYAYTKKNDYVVLHEYIDRAISGTTDNRPEFRKMIEDSKSKSFDYVLVYQLDRFARNRYDSAIHKATLKKNNVRVLSAKENISEDASGVLVEGMLESFAEYYSAELGQKVKRGIHESLLKGKYIGGNILFGYDVVDMKYVVNSTESEIVKSIFDDYYNGKGTKAIAKRLNDEGITSKKGTLFTMNSLMRILRNEKYTGKCVVNEVIYPNIYPPIIEERVFDRCQELMDMHKHKARTIKEDEHPYILSGKLYCGECFSLMTAETGTSRTGAIHHYYKCYGKKKSNQSCNKTTVRLDYIENLVFEKTSDYVLQSEIIDKIAKIVTQKFNSEISSNTVLICLENDLKDKTQSINNILKAIEKGICTKSTQDRLQKLETEKEEIEDKISVEKARQIEPIKEDDIKKFLLLFKNRKIDDKIDRNEFFNNFIQRVILYNDRITIIYNTSLEPQNELYYPINKDDNNLSGGTLIYSNKDQINDNNESKKDNQLMTLENKEKSRSNSNEFKRQAFGGECES